MQCTGCVSRGSVACRAGTGKPESGERRRQLEQSGGEVQNLLNQMQQASIKHIEFRDDRFVAAVAVDEYQPVTRWCIWRGR
ncbi:hypothetical protein DMH88_12255 [Escherichia coli]|nr:hypothetical protein [Escherichia coli]